jgi:hypothetical protein
VASWTSVVGNGLSRHHLQPGRGAPPKARGRIAKIATFDIKIESMRFALRSAKGAGKASWRHVYESAVTAAGFYIRQTAVRS